MGKTKNQYIRKKECVYINQGGKSKCSECQWYNFVYSTCNLCTDFKWDIKAAKKFLKGEK